MGLPNVNHAVHRSEVSEGLSLAYIREGVGGYPLLLIHGFPETKRIWYRNIGPLAGAGFEVIVPDLRGFGDSDLSADGFYDPAAYAKDLCTLVHDVLGPTLAPHSWGNYSKTRGHPEPRQQNAAPPSEGDPNRYRRLSLSCRGRRAPRACLPD